MGGTFQFCYDYDIPQPADKEFHKGFVLVELFKKKTFSADKLAGSSLISLATLFSQNRVEGLTEFYYKDKGRTIQIHVEECYVVWTSSKEAFWDQASSKTMENYEVFSRV